METIRWFIKKSGEDKVSAHSAQVTFFIVVSMFPFILLFLTLLQFTPLTQDVLMDSLARVFPASLKDTIGSWISEVYTTSSGAVISITVITALWSGSKGFLGIDSSLQDIYDTTETRNFFRLRIVAMLYTIIFCLMILGSLIVLVYGNRIVISIGEKFPVINGVIMGIFYLRGLIGLSFFFLFFVILYLFLPNRKATFKSQMPGAMFTSVLWILFSYLYSIYIDYYTNFSSIYGSLTYIVLFMLWLYICMNIVFIGGEINVFLDEKNITPKTAVLDLKNQLIDKLTEESSSEKSEK